MFLCQITKQQSKVYEKPIRIVTERREKIYTDKHGAEIGRGWEIASEISVGMEGLKQWVASHPEDTESAERYVRLVKAEKAAQDYKLREGSTTN